MTTPPVGAGGGQGERFGGSFSPDYAIPHRYPTTLAHGRGVELLRQLQRRHDAAQRVSGGDPLVPAERALGREREHRRPYRPHRPPLTDYALDGWAAAARHVLDSGHVPIVPVDVARRLWRRGSADRELAELLHRHGGTA